MQKDVFNHNFRTKVLKITILESRSMFLRSRNLMVPFILPMTLPLQGHDLCEITFWATSQLLMGNTWPNFRNRVALVRAYKCFDDLSTLGY